MTPGEGTKGSDIQGSDESPDESDDAQVRVTMVTGVRHNEQPGDLEAGEGAHVTVPPSSCKTPTKGTIPEIRSGPITSAEAQETCSRFPAIHQ